MFGSLLFITKITFYSPRRLEFEVKSRYIYQHKYLQNEQLDQDSWDRTSVLNALQKCDRQSPKIRALSDILEGTPSSWLIFKS